MSVCRLLEHLRALEEQRETAEARYAASKEKQQAQHLAQLLQVLQQQDGGQGKGSGDGVELKLAADPTNSQPGLAAERRPIAAACHPNELHSIHECVLPGAGTCSLQDLGEREPAPGECLHHGASSNVFQLCRWPPCQHRQCSGVGDQHGILSLCQAALDLAYHECWLLRSELQKTGTDG